ncbi:TRAP transporter small permease subunit (plasmid) [Leisingera sp. M527]|nr:TRAP transporter small permease subunit [Leisingera sp. M527]
MSADRLAALAGQASNYLAKATERVVVVLMAVLVLMVWLGIMVRYFVDLPITFTEEASRYLMIWVALLAVSIGISKRSHIGVLTVFDMMGRRMQRLMLLTIDITAFSLFAFLFFYSFGMVEKGWSRVTMIYFIPKSIPFMIVPVATALAAVQIVLSAMRDQFGGFVEPGASQSDI